ncbi:hypothetical protein HGB24_03555 [Candidatus Saccharibacteria bacterium]|nr:hypothetical protein [Candidatus Saccharibacteria bacterium]
MAISLALGSLLIVPSSNAYAAIDDLTIENGANNAQGASQASNLFGDDGVFKNITNAALFIIGAVSVLMLIYGGIRYTISGGDSAAVTAAKNTIMYAIVGIIVALMAFAIVNWVLKALLPS